MIPADIFSRIARRRQRTRMLKYGPDDRWLIKRMSEDIVERLDAVRHQFTRALIIGSDLGNLRALLAQRGIVSIVADSSFAIAAMERGVVCDEDRLPFADGSFDLVIAISALDTVTDLPGALILIRRSLTEDGLFLGTMVGAGSLPALRSALKAEDGDRQTARFHPQLDVRGAGDLLARAGFLLPVAESETVSVRYRALDRLIEDLRANGLTNVLAERYAMSKSALDRARRAFAKPTTEQFATVTLTGWGRPVK